MWIVNFLPSWLFYLLAIAGLAGIVVSYVLKNIPVVGSNAIAVRIIAAVAFVLGVWFCGADSNNEAWVARVKEMEAKVAKAERESAEANDALAKKANQKIEVVKYREVVVKQYIDREIVKYDEKFSKDGICAIPPEFVKAHNDAATPPSTK